MVGRSAGILQSFKEIGFYRGLSGFYSGYRATIIRDIVFSATQMTLFEHLRK